MNNRTIDISNVKEKVVIIELSSDFLEQPQDITIKGLDSDTKDGQVVIINVQSSKDALNLATKTRLIYDDNTQLSPNESHAKPNHILWNFGNKVKTVNISSGYFMGSVLAPNAEVNVDVNVDGNLVAQTVNIRGGESHRWDLWEPVTPIFPRPVIPHWHGEEEFVEPSKDHGKPDGGKNTPGKPSDGKQPVKADIDKSQDSQPGKSDQPSQPTSPVKSQDSKPGKSSNVTPVQPTSPSKPTEPGKSTNVTKPTSPVQPTNPGKPAQPVKAVEHSQSSAESAQLPQTGNKDNKLGIIGLMVASVVVAINLLKKEF
jgi:LPXTG-motif cell wall-anchored protein